MGHEDAFPRSRLNARYSFSKGSSRGRGATGEMRRLLVAIVGASSKWVSNAGSVLPIDPV